MVTGEMKVWGPPCGLSPTPVTSEDESVVSIGTPPVNVFGLRRGSEIRKWKTRQDIRPSVVS